jgi:hypothetical protein
MSLKQSNGALDASSSGISEPLPGTALPLEELSRTITKTAGIISHHLAANNLPQPSRDADGPAAILPSDTPESIQRARQALLAASLEIFQLAAGPSEFLPNLATSVSLFECSISLLISSLQNKKREPEIAAYSNPKVPIYLLPNLALPIQHLPSCSTRYLY